MTLVAPEAFLRWCLERVGKPYVWGAKGPDAFDCSGLVTAGVLACGGPDWRQTHNSARLFDVLAPTQWPVAGGLAFYGPPHRVVHVMVVVGDGRVFGAAGGGSQTTTPTKGACVQFRASVDYRRDRRGFRALALRGESNGTQAGL